MRADKKSEDDDALVAADRKRSRVEATGFALHEVVGDLFEGAEAADSLAHCVSQCMSMGKGIAVAFKQHFGGVEALRAQKAGIGAGAVLPRPHGGDSAFVYYLVTKAKFWNKPTLAALVASLRWMREHCVAHGVKAISMPRIGCGLDGLRWEDVRDAIVREFSDTDIAIKVFRL